MTSVSFNCHVQCPVTSIVLTSYLFIFIAASLGSAQEIPSKLKLMMFVGDAKS